MFGTQEVWRGQGAEESREDGDVRLASPRWGRGVSAGGRGAHGVTLVCSPFPVAGTVFMLPCLQDCILCEPISTFKARLLPTFPLRARKVQEVCTVRSFCICEFVSSLKRMRNSQSTRTVLSRSLLHVLRGEESGRFPAVVTQGEAPSCQHVPSPWPVVRHFLQLCALCCFKRPQ